MRENVKSYSKEKRAWHVECNHQLTAIVCSRAYPKLVSPPLAPTHPISPTAYPALHFQGAWGGLCGLTSSALLRAKVLVAKIMEQRLKKCPTLILFLRSIKQFDLRMFYLTWHMFDKLSVSASRALNWASSVSRCSSEIEFVMPWTKKIQGKFD